MSITAKIIADSIAPCGKRLTTYELVYPRFIHSELMTHRVFSRNAASSRAIPIEKMNKRILENPAEPVFWAANQKGMQAEVELDEAGKEAARDRWLAACASAVHHSREMAKLGIHKQVANRLTEPFQHMVTLVSATEYANFFALRAHPAAQQEFQVLAKAMLRLFLDNKPTALGPGEWHLPYIRTEDRLEAMTMAGDFTQSLEQKARIGLEIVKKVSVGRCARTSYLNQDGVRALADDVSLHDRLLNDVDKGDPGHFSPFEHIARAEMHDIPSGNFSGFTQYRKTFRNENFTTLPKL
jgi:thymidylate synthase ThyX